MVLFYCDGPPYFKNLFQCEAKNTTALLFNEEIKLLQ